MEWACKDTEMGLLSLTLPKDLSANWRRILDDKGLHVYQMETDDRGVSKDSTWVVETPWRVSNGDTEITILEATYKEVGRAANIVFMPVATKQQRQLLTMVKQALIARGATVRQR